MPLDSPLGVKEGRPWRDHGGSLYAATEFQASPRSHLTSLTDRRPPVNTVTRERQSIEGCLHLLAAELIIRFSYPLLTQRDGAPAVALAVDDNTLAGQILLRKRFTLLGEEDLG